MPGLRQPGGGDLCPICRDESRDRSLLAVVETVADLYALERSGEFPGVYHVLGGALNPLEGVGPKELNLESLWPRLAGVQEVVLATSMTVEGRPPRSTWRRNSDAGGKGHPAGLRPARGGSLEYADEVTLGRALEGRKPV